jgi:hypothetical protein
MTQNDSTIRSPFGAVWIDTLTKSDLHTLIDDVKIGVPEATSRATMFVACESFGIWHNRARAKLCRYFKNHPPSDDECNRMVDAIAKRINAGSLLKY